MLVHMKLLAAAIILLAIPGLAPQDGAPKRLTVWRAI